MTDERDERGQFDEVAAALRQWRQAHPSATLTEIEQELDRRLRVARAGLLAEVATSAAVAVGECPDCGTPLVRRGTHERRLRTDGDQPIPLSRPYAQCPACGRGLFPPG